jgi:hypothetical protein
VKTNNIAKLVLTSLKTPQHVIDDVMKRSIKKTVELILRNQGVQASEFNATLAPFASGFGVTFTQECAAKVLRTVQQELRAMRTDPEQFSTTRPMAHEVLEFLRQNCISSFAMVLANHDIDTLAMVASLSREQVALLSEEHEQIYPLRGKQGTVGGQMSLQMAVDALKGDERTKSLKVRLDSYKDKCSSAMAVFIAGNSMEMAFSKGSLRVFLFAFGLLYAGLTTALLVDYTEQFLKLGCAAGNGCVREPLWLGMRVVGYVSHVSASLALIHPLIKPTPLAAYHTFTRWLAAYVFLQLVQVVGLGAFMTIFWTDICVWLILPFGWLICVYRQRWFGAYMLVAACVYAVSAYALQCQRESHLEFQNYAECWARANFYLPLIVSPFLYGVVYLSARYVINSHFAWRRGRSDRSAHYRAWKAEVVRAKADGSVQTLCLCADTIIKELNTQRRNVLKNLTNIEMINAWLNLHVGRVSLRTRDPKARQAHGDIDVLFREAAAVRV